MVARPRLLVWLMAASLALLTIVAYWPVTGHDFVNYDDPEYVVQNPHVTDGFTWANVGRAFGNLELGFWHPLTWLSIMADCQWHGMHPGGHHLTNLLLHAASSAALFLALLQMTGAAWRSATVAALFALHPLHVESVAWVAERKDVLSGFFWMLTLLMYGRYARQSKVQGAQSRVFYALTLLFFACGLMSKPMVVTLPLILLLLDWWPLQRFGPTTAQDGCSAVRRLLWEKAPLLGAALAAGLVTVYAERRHGALGATTQFPLAERIQNACLSYGAYLKQTFWPVDLAVFYPYPEAFPAWRAAGAGLAGLMICVFVLRGAARRPYLAVGWIWYVVTLLPVIGLIQVGGFSRADRFAYLPLIGVFIALAWGAYELTGGWRRQVLALSMAGAAASVLCLGLTRQQLGHWKDSEALFRHALAVTENNYLAHNNLGVAIAGKGQTNEAIVHFQEAVRLNPDFAASRCNFGVALYGRGHTEEAIRQYREAIRLKPDYAAARYNLGVALYKQGQLDEAVSEYYEAMRLKPDDTLARNLLGVALLEQGQIDEAIRQHQEAIRLKPDDADGHYHLGNALAKKGQIDEAISQFRKALRLKPDKADAHYNLANALVRKGQIDEAITQYQEAIRLKPDDADAHSNFGVALWRQGRNAEAVRQFREALRLKPDHADARRNLDVALAARTQSSKPPGAATNR